MNDAASAPNQLDEFVEDMIREKDLPGMTEEVLPGLVEETTQQLREIIDMAVIDAMPSAKQAELNQVLENPATSTDTVSEFIMSSGVDVTKVTTDTMVRFRKLYIEGPGASE